MATRTLILRPVSVELVKPSNSDKAIATVTPSDTSSDKYHLLLSEETADNDSTYISIAYGSYINVLFETLPKNMTINAFRITATAKSPDDTTSTTKLLFKFYDTDNAEIDSVESDLTYADLSSSYTKCTGSSDLFMNELRAMSDLSYSFRLAAPNHSDEIKITQLYAEVEYSGCLLKENGTWTFCPYIFQKVNGSWVSTTNSVLVENELYNIGSISSNGGDE